MNTQGAQVLVGIGGWEHEVFDTCFYPQAGMTSEDKLSYYARFFDAVEVRSTFWDETLSDSDAARWVEAVNFNKRFMFNVKLHSSFTHKQSVKPHITRAIRSVLHELQRHDKLGALIVQFPYAFTNTSAHRYHVIKLSEIFSGFPIHVEFRHESWNQATTNTLLAEHGMLAVNTDLPRIRQHIPFTTTVIGNAAYMRLHGRNDKGWLVNADDVRYDYLYNAREVRELSRRIDVLTQKCDRVTVICNNTTNGKALANALQLRAAVLHGKSLIAPAATLAAFPDIKAIAAPAIEPSLLTDWYRNAV
ncbi:MAG: DUF72 domain-containing protein [Bacteroidota bacterium]